MSIPQICPSCGNHITQPHMSNCAYSTPEYAHIGWPNYQIPTTTNTTYTISHLPHITMEELTAASNAALDKFKKLKEQENATAIRRLLEYLEEEPESNEIAGEMAPNFAAITLLKKRAEELRKEAAGISLVEARKKREFTVDVLNQLISELTE